MRLTWDNLGERLFRVGADRGVLYMKNGSEYGNGVAWNGLTGVEESYSGREVTSFYTNDIRSYLLKTKPELGGTIRCYTYPPEFELCLGGVEAFNGLVIYDQDESAFGVTYRKVIGNDTEGIDFAHEVHIYYGMSLTTNTSSASTISESIDAEEFSFGFTSIPESFPGYYPVSHLKFTSNRLYDMQWERLENTLYGTETEDSYLPLPDDLIRYLEVVILNGSVVWDDNDDEDHLRPDRLLVTLYGEVGGVKSIVERKYVSAEDNWTFAFGPLFKYDGEEEITFSVDGVTGEEIVSEADVNLISEIESFKFVTEEFWPCRYDETVDGFVLTETRNDDPIE